MDVLTYVCTYVRMYVCMYVCTYVCMYACMYACMYILYTAHTHMYICMYTRYILNTQALKGLLYHNFRLHACTRSVSEPPGRSTTSTETRGRGFYCTGMMATMALGVYAAMVIQLYRRKHSGSMSATTAHAE